MKVFRKRGTLNWYREVRQATENDALNRLRYGGCPAPITDEEADALASHAVWVVNEFALAKQDQATAEVTPRDGTLRTAKFDSFTDAIAYAYDLSRSYTHRGYAFGRFNGVVPLYWTTAGTVAILMPPVMITVIRLDKLDADGVNVLPEVFDGFPTWVWD